jgi:hypothetical protein
MNRPRRAPGSRRRHAPLLAIALLVAGCRLASLDATPPPAPRETMPWAHELDPDAACVLDPDPANGGHPALPAVVAEANDPVDPAGVVAIAPVGLGDIVLPSDTLLVADLFMMAVDPSLQPAVDLEGTTGRFPVCAHIAHLEPADQRVAWLHVKVSDEPVVRWTVGTDGFGVDGGTGGIGSAEAVRAAGPEIVDDYLAALEANSVDTWGWVNVVTDPATGANVIGFSTGYGDGGYPVFVGHDADGRVASVLIDLLVVPWRWLGRTGPVATPSP